MVAVRQKPVAALAFKRGGRGNVPQLPPAPAVIPEPPAGLGEYAVARWVGFFSQPTAGLVNMKRDGERLAHWAWAVEQREKMRKIAAEQPVVSGSMGQAVASPAWLIIAKLTADIERAEMAFGMTPLAKMRLTGALDQAEAAEGNIRKRREGRRPELLPARAKP